MTQQINLLNPDLRRRRDWLSFAMVAPAALLVFALVTADALWVRTEERTLAAQESEVAAQLNAAQERLQAAAKAVGARSGDPALVGEAERLRVALQLRREALQLLQAGDIGDTAGFSAIMTGLARQSMEGLWLTGFAAGGGELEIRGRMLDPALLPAYIKRLNGEPAFQGRRFAELEMKGVAPGPVEANPPAAAAPAAPAAPAASPAPAAPLPHYTEFALRTVGAAGLGKSGGER